MLSVKRQKKLDRENIQMATVVSKYNSLSQFEKDGRMGKRYQEKIADIQARIDRITGEN